MAVRAKDGARAFRKMARSMFFSSATIDEHLAGASAAQARAVCSSIEIEQRNRAAARHRRLLRRAKFPVPMGFDGYDFSHVSLPEGYAEQDLRSLGLIEKRRDFVLYGPTGRGKTHLATAIGLAAVDAGMEVRFFNVASLVVHLSRLKEEREIEPFMNDLQKASLVILDEFGYVPLDIEGARLLYQVISQCHGRRSIVITTNIEFGKWGAVLGDDKMASALVDRLVYHGRMVEFTGASHRMENALMLGRQSGGDAR